jgi:1-acyl-sn-glycerol-3-phosphate acyltransferase
VRLPWPLQYVAGVAATLVAAPVVWAFALAGRPRAAYAPIRTWCRALHLVTGVHFRVHGRERIPAGPYVVISNHCSHLDGPTLICAFPDPLYFVIKKELLRIPLWGPTTVRAGFIAIDRADAEQARREMARTAEAVRAGHHVLVFAEGTRSPTGELLPFKKGGFHLALDAQVPLLPVAINGSRRLLPKGAPGAVSGVIDVVVGEPVPTSGLTKDDLPELLEAVRSRIAEMRRADPDCPA